MMKKGSQFTRFFNHEIRKLEETGNLDIHRKRYSGSKTCKQPVNEKPLGFEKLSFLFFILIIGCIVSVFVAFVEYMTQAKKNKQELGNKYEKMLLIEEKMGQYLEGLSYQETEHILGRLFLQHIKMDKECIKKNIDGSADFDLELVPDS